MEKNLDNNIMAASEPPDRDPTSEQMRPDETLEDLELRGLKLLQKARGFRFGIDAVLLAHFTGLKNRERVMDLCTGSGIIPLLFAGKTDARDILGLELQVPYADMADRSVKLNGLEDRVRILPGDVRDRKLLASLGRFDVVTCNPPYKARGTGLINPADEKMIARHEVTLELADVIAAAALLLRDQGRLCLVHRPERLFDIYQLMADHQMELKRVRLVAPAEGKAPNLLLAEGVKGQKPYLKWEPQLTVYQANGRYTDEIKEIYQDGRH